MKRVKWRSLGLALALPLVAVFGVLLSVQISAEEADVWEQPHRFFGNLTIIGEGPAPVGTQVEARGEGVVTGIDGNPLTTNAVGEYGGGRDPVLTDKNLLVQGPEIAEGTPLEFYVNGARAQVREVDPDTGDYVGDWRDTYPWSYDGETILDMQAPPAEEYALTVNAGACCPVMVTHGEVVSTVAAAETGLFAGQGLFELEAVTDTCCSFLEWAIETGGEIITATENPNELTLDADTVVTATCSASGPFSLTANVEPAEAGSVALNPEQPAEGYECCTTVTATAEAAEFYTFEAWGGDIGEALSTTESITVHMGMDREITATFSQVEYTLAVTSTGCASVTMSYDDVSETVAPGASAAFSVPGGVTATLEMEGTCCSFEEWIVDGVSQDGEQMISIFMDGDRQVEAVSDPPPFDLTVNVDPMEGGMVTVDPEEADYACNDVVTVTAVPTTGFVFTGWMGDLTTMNATEQITMTENKEITATFGSAEVDLTVTSEGCCSIEVTYDTVTDTVEADSMDVFTIERFTEVSLEAMQEGVCSFDGWMLDGEPLESNLITFSMDDDREAVATCSVTTIYLPIMMKFYP